MLVGSITYSVSIIIASDSNLVSWKSIYYNESTYMYILA